MIKQYSPEVGAVLDQLGERLVSKKDLESAIGASDSKPKHFAKDSSSVQ